MKDLFIHKIAINKVRHLEGIEIPLSDSERKHLILTGRNGSGKSQVLIAMSEYFADITNKEFIHNYYREGGFITAHFDAKRTSQLKKPNGITKIDLKKHILLKKKPVKVSSSTL
ncbi:MAG: hypothetical protein GY754_08520 [bacterium]|nr:hypothetical protein [bacterium]